jgi:methionine--tRNA ligase beta chain
MKLFIKYSLTYMNVQVKYFKNSTSKLENIIAKLDNQLGLYNQFGKNHSTIPELNEPKLIKEKMEKDANFVSEGKNLKDTKATKESKEPKVLKDSNEQKDIKKPKEEKLKKEENPSVKIIESFNDIDLRVGKVVKIINMEGSENLYHCWVDVGEGTIREIGCGLRKFGVSMEEFTKLPIVVFANLKPKKLANIMSNGMILCCEKVDTKEFELVRPPADSEAGDSVFIEGTLPKEKMADFLSANKFGKAVPLLRSTDKLIASYSGLNLQTTKGYLSVTRLKDCPIS